MSALQQLLDMGFSQDKAENALKFNNNNFESSMEYLLAHADDGPLPVDVATPNAPDKTDEDPAKSAQSSSAGTEPEEAKEAKSIKCGDCGRLFKTQLEVEFHATKSGHSNFEESTEEKAPLTEEQKKAQMALLEEKMRLKRIEREQKEKQEALERERLRIKSGKDLGEAKRLNEEAELKKILDERKRDKLMEKQARERVRAQIESDKAARRAKAEGLQITSPPVAPVVVQSPTSSVASPPKDYKQTKIQIRLPNGTTLTETFDKNEQLAAVRLFVQLKQGDEAGTTTFGLMTNFPRKVFGSDDYGMTLEMLGLVPSATLMVTRATF